MVSAMNDQEEVLHGLAQGADDYVVKPLNLGNLLQRGEALLRANLSRSEIDELTQLPGLDGIRRGIQRLSSMRQTFAVAHCELMQLREYARERGMDSRDEAIKFLGNALKEAGAEFASEQFFVGHVGGGHFIALIPPSGIKPFCQSVADQWNGAKDRFRPAATGQAKSAGKEPAKLDLLVCVTLREPKDTTTPQQLFEILSQLRQKAQQSGRVGIHLDRRALTPRSEAERKRKKQSESRRKRGDQPGSS
jgi:GGDEF domain-containing protein